MSIETDTATVTALPVAIDRLHRISLDQYHHLIEIGLFRPSDRLVLLDGLLVDKMTKGPRHSTACELGREVISAALPAGWHVRQEQPITLPAGGGGGGGGHDSEPEPDLAVVAGVRGAYKAAHPGPGAVGLVVEFAETRIAEERRALGRYARAAIPVAWLVDLINRTIEVHSDPTGPQHDYRSVVVSKAGETVTFPLPGGAGPIGPFPVEGFLP